MAAAVRFIEDSLACLAIGGVAVHTLTLHVGAVAEMPDGDAGPFRRRDIERLAFALIANGHEVAQIKYELGTGAGTVVTDRDVRSGSEATSFGLIVRKGGD